MLQLPFNGESPEISVQGKFFVRTENINYSQLSILAGNGYTVVQVAEQLQIAEATLRSKEYGIHLPSSVKFLRSSNLGSNPQGADPPPASYKRSEGR